MVLKPKVFAAEILPDHFKSAKYSSFTRKLHRWGFTRHYKGDDSGAYYHPEFQRDRIDLVEQMTCLKAGEPTPVAIKSNATESSSAVVSSAVHEAELRRTSMATVSPVVARTAVNNTTAQALLLSHRPLLSIPVPKQQMRLPTQQQMGLPMPGQDAVVAAKINAAIELEVARRLQERIAAATQMSRVPNTPAALNSLMPRVPLPAVQRPVPANAAAPSSHESLRLKLIQMQQQKEQMQYLAMTGAVSMPSQGLEEMPKTNIQGAKTA